jgi:hypothetical protein
MRPLTAADRTPEIGDVLRYGRTGIPGTVRFVCPDHFVMQNGDAVRDCLLYSYWGWLEYISRADGGPVTKEGE